MEERRIMLGDEMGGGIVDTSSYLAYITFDNDTTDDYFGYNTSASGTRSFQDGKYGRCLQTTSSTTTTYPSTSLLAQYFQNEIGGGAGDYSVDFWVYLTGIFRLGITAGPEIYLQGNNLISLQAGSENYLEIQPTQIAGNGWHHICYQFFEYGPSSYTIWNYVDGKVMGEVSGVSVYPYYQGFTQHVSFMNSGIWIDQYRIMKGICFSGNYDSVDQILENCPYPDQIN